MKTQERNEFEDIFPPFSEKRRQIRAEWHHLNDAIDWYEYLRQCAVKELILNS